jgi:protein-tyrosine phosphatase
MRILMVCLGNICRSPLAEGILRKKAIEKGIKITIDSAGTSGWHNGENPDKRTIANARKNGVDVSEIVSRKFVKDDFEQFDIIYAMDKSNFKNIVSIAPSEAYKSKVKLILHELGESIEEVPDPYYGGESSFQHVFDLLDKATDKIIEKFKTT